MSTQRQLRRGTTAQIAAATPAIGEMWADTSIIGRVIIGDGVTAGGKNMNYNTSGLIDAPKGVQFPSVAVLSSDPNALDDYKEGTFTPTILFGGASTGITYATQVGSYTKIGNRFMFSLHIVLSSKGTATGSVAIAGLPYTYSATPANNFAVLSVRALSLNASMSVPPTAYVGSGFTNIGLAKFASGSLTVMTDADFTNTSDIAISGHYHV